MRPVDAGPVARLYVCGITPYDATHLGHAATYVTFDLVGRALRDAGHRVEYVQNVTDVDDPLLERAARDGRDWRELATRRDRPVPRGHDGAGRHPPGRPRRGRRVDARDHARGAGAARRWHRLPAARARGRGLRRRHLPRPRAGPELRVGLGLVARADGCGVRRPRRRPGPARQARPLRPAALARRARRRAVLARRGARRRPARVAHRVHGHLARPARPPARHPGRRHRPRLPPPRDERGAVRGADPATTPSRGTTCTRRWSASRARR